MGRASAPTALQQPMSLVVKSFAAAGGEVIRDPPNQAESAAIWFCRSATTVEDGAPDDADVPDDAGASVISWTHLRAVPMNLPRISVSGRSL